MIMADLDIIGLYQHQFITLTVVAKEININT